MTTSTPKRFTCVPTSDGFRRIKAMGQLGWKMLREVAPGWDADLPSMKQATEKAATLTHMTGIEFYATEFEEV